MWNHGYYQIDEIAEKLGVSVTFVMNEVEREHLRYTLTLYGEPQFFGRDIERWNIRRASPIRDAQLDLRRLLDEVIQAENL